MQQNFGNVAAAPVVLPRSLVAAEPEPTRIERESRQTQPQKRNRSDAARADHLHRWRSPRTTSLADAWRGHHRLGLLATMQSTAPLDLLSLLDPARLRMAQTD